MTANQLVPGSTASRPLSALIDVTQHAVQQVLDAAETQASYMAIARLSGHLAAMWRAVYPSADGQSTADGPLRAVCLSRAREVERTLRLLECQLSGAASAADLPVTAVATLLAQHLASYRSAEQALVTAIEDQLATEGREKLAREYGHAFRRAPTRPHPQCPRSGPLRRVVFWMRSHWDRLLDTVDARPGVGRDFLVQLPYGRPASSGDENSRA